jgi:PKD domain
MKTAKAKQSLRRVLLHLAVLASCLSIYWSGPQAAAQAVSSPGVPLAQISIPPNGAVLSGTAMIMAHQINPVLGPAVIRSIRFQYSADDGGTWMPIDTVQFLGNGTGSQDFYDSVVYWDTNTVPSGAYLLRALYVTVSANVVTPPVQVTVNHLPNAIASGDFLSSDYVELSGATSYDPDGSITAWNWDFGDGNLGSGPQVTHTYAPGIYTAVLTVTDNQGAQSSDYLLVDPADQQVAPQQNCVGKKIELGIKDKAVYRNPRFMKGDFWLAWMPEIITKKDGTPHFEHDGLTLGPLSKNPLNTTPYWGYVFEMRVTVAGTPSECKEIQILRKTTKTAPGTVEKADCLKLAGGTFDKETMVCTYHTGWTGKKDDFDQDGTTDLDLSSEDKCKAQNGTWDADKMICNNAAFPVDGKAYKPDEEKQGEKDGGYRSPYTYKQYVGQQILWFDAPATATEGSDVNANFVAIIRSTDKTCGEKKDGYCYCYHDFNVLYTVGKKDSEKIVENSNGCGVDKTKVPGLK